jgi:hypothetical protein
VEEGKIVTSRRTPTTFCLQKNQFEEAYIVGVRWEDSVSKGGASSAEEKEGVVVGEKITMKLKASIEDPT